MKIIVGVLSVCLVAVIGLCGYLGIQCINKDKQLTEMQYNLYNQDKQLKIMRYNLDNTVTVLSRAVQSYSDFNDILVEGNNKMVIELVDIANR